MSGLAPQQVVTLVEILVILMGIGITWLVYLGSDRAELPGQSEVPDPTEAEDRVSDTRGRTLS
jgi:hypothetical protein